MKLYGYWRSSSSWRVRIALELKGLDYETVPVHLLEGGGEQHRPEFREVNPMRQVPVLVDGELVLGQSMAVIEYLDETHPDPPLLPADPVARARVRQMAEAVNAGIQPLQNLGVLQMLRGFGVDAKSWAQSWIVRGFTGLEALAERDAGRFLYGDSVTLADLYLVPQLYNARRFGASLDRFPTLTRVEAACLELDAFQAAHPDRQPDAPTED